MSALRRFDTLFEPTQKKSKEDYLQMAIRSQDIDVTVGSNNVFDYLG